MPTAELSYSRRKSNEMRSSLLGYILHIICTLYLMFRPPTVIPLQWQHGKTFLHTLHSYVHAHTHTHTLHTGFLDPDGSTVIDGVLVVVDGGIVPNEVEVPFKLIQACVDIPLHLLPHCAEVHWVLDDVMVVWDLQKVSKPSIYSQ